MYIANTFVSNEGPSDAHTKDSLQQSYSYAMSLTMGIINMWHKWIY